MTNQSTTLQQSTEMPPSTSSSSSATSQTSISPSQSTATAESSSVSPSPETVNNCDNNNCTNGGSCINGQSNYTCNCTSGYTGWLCDQVNYCDNNNCTNGGSCMNGQSNYTCNCTSGWTGLLCDQDKDDCSPNPCKNNGTCMDNGTNSFICNCTVGWQGLMCDEDVNECADNPCVNGTCHNEIGTGVYNCSCDVDFEGTNCDKVIDNCVSFPCKNGGHCTDGIGDFTCNCTTGWTGKTCEEDVKECEDPNMCQNGGYCKEGMGNYTCLCTDGWEGPNCEEDIDECKTHCMGTGYNCTNNNGSYICQCDSNYMNTGTNGEIMCEEIMMLPDNANSMKYTMRGQIVGPIMLDFRIPVFNTFYKSLYVSMNGYLTFGDKYMSDYPPSNTSDWTDAPMIKMLAPYWWYNDVPEGGALSISQWVAWKALDKPMIDRVSNILNFTADMVFMATWDKFTPYPSSEFSDLTAKFQVVIATDGKQSTAMFNYDHVWKASMDRQPATFVRSTMVQELEEPANNKRIIVPLSENDGLTMNNTDFECAWSLSKLPAKTINASSCPCTIQQAEQDFQFMMTSDDTDKQCFQNLFPVGSDKSFKQWCCYEKKSDSLINGMEKTAGYGVLVNANHSTLQTDAHSQCCGPMSSMCMHFYGRFPAASCANYENLLALSWGDPHFHMFDSTQQTFNGYGEYHLLNHIESDFKSQIRTIRVEMADGAMANATVIVHLAIKHGANSVEVMAKNELLETYLNSVKIDTSSYSDDLIYLIKDGQMLKAGFSNGVSFMVMPFQNYMSISTSMMADDSTSGLLGNMGRPESDSTESQFYTFGQKYLVENETMSIFNYSLQTGNFSTNQHADFTPTFYRDMSLDQMFDNDTKAAATSLCDDLQECLVDYAATNNSVFANNTKMEYQKFKDQKNIFMNVSEKAMTYSYPLWTFTIRDMSDEIEKQLGLENASIETNIPAMYYTFNMTSGMFSLNVSNVMSDWDLKFVSGSSTIQPMIHVCRCKEASECLSVSEKVSDQIVDQSCNCSANREGRYCETDIDVCRQCYVTAVCNSTNQGSPCTCPEGMEGDGTHCYDVDECNKDASNECDQICDNFIGGYNCSCRDGYIMEGKGTCKDIDECKDSSLNNCTEREYCSNKPGAYLCTCKAQYKRDPEGECVKIAVIYGGDLVFASTVGSQTWSPKLKDKTSEEFKALATIVEKEIKEAFEKSGKTKDKLVAVTVTEFSLYDPSSRRKRSTDTNDKIAATYEVAFKEPVPQEDLDQAIDDQLSCSSSCSLGSINGVSKDDSKISVNYDRCQNGENHDCQMSSTECKSVNGSFSCVCKPGFKPWDLADNACEDIDECKADNSNITDLCGAEGTKCINKPGNYTCECNPDYEFDTATMKCVSVNHCKSSPCVNGECVNIRVEPYYACKCYFGYTNPKCDGEDKDALRQRTTIIAVSATLGVLCFLLIIAVCYMCCKSSRKKSNQHSISMSEYTKFKGLPRAHLSGHENAMMENETNGDYRQSHEL